MTTGTGKAGFREIAAAAGVSLSTVDRVMNDRGGVSPARSRAVLEAARELGIGRLLPDAWQRTCRIDLVLPRNKPGNLTPFWRRMAGLAQKGAQNLPGHVVVSRTMVPEGDAKAQIATILHPSAPRDALIIAADTDPSVAGALKAAMDRGELVITVVGDVTGLPGHSYCGVDNHAMGRTAGLLMRKSARPGRRILILRANDHRHEHHERSSGFIESFGDDGAIDTILTFEDVAATRDTAARILAAGDIGGIYVTGHEPEALGDLLRGMDPRPVWISHELSAPHARLLREGLLDYVLDQNPQQQILHAIWLAVRSRTDGDHDTPMPPPAEFRIYTGENLPSDMQE